MKSITCIRNEKPVYFVCINGANEYESYSFNECKGYLVKYLKAIKENGIKIENTSDYYIGMYSITID